MFTTGLGMKNVLVKVKPDIKNLEMEINLSPKINMSEHTKSIVAVKKERLKTLYKIRRAARINELSWLLVPAFNIIVINLMLKIMAYFGTGHSPTSWTALLVFIVIIIMANIFSARALKAWVLAKMERCDDALATLRFDLEKLT